MTIAVLTAAGIGSRMKSQVPKQFLPVRDRPVLAYTMMRFQTCARVDGILVVARAEWSDEVVRIAQQHGIGKFIGWVPGGATGQESIHNALRHLSLAYPASTTVIVHDGNRPMVDDDILTDALKVAKEKGNAIAAIPCAEVAFRRKGEFAEEVPREELLRTQTPHVFSLGAILGAYDEALFRGMTGMAASCQLLARLGVPINFSRGKETNIKLTTPDDMDIFKALLAQGRVCDAGA